MMHQLREPVNALTHLTGAVMAAVGLLVLLVQAARGGTVYHWVAFVIFGISMILLYTASGLYHALRVSPKALLTLRRLDHMSIYLLIAGTYTPFCLLPLRGPWGWSLLGAIWGLALVGILVKAFWMSAPRWLYVLFYVLMGWIVVVALRPMAQATPAPVLAWLITGGLVYTLGAVIYALKWPNWLPGRFGFHEVWHLFVMGGTASHFVAVYLLV